jgi:hypothetical protein
MLWIIYLWDTYWRLGYEGGFWAMLFICAGVATCIIPVIAIGRLLRFWERLSAKERWHCLIAIFIY